MKKSILLISLMAVAMAVFAIDYPTYKPITPTYGGSNNGSGSNNSGTTYGGYSTTTSGGTTTYGEGAATGPSRVGPRRVHAGGTTPPDPNGDYEWVDDSGNYWVYNPDAQQWEAGLLGSGAFWKPADVDDNRIPVGSPMVMLLFAAMAAAVVAWRRKKIAC